MKLREWLNKARLRVMGGESDKPFDAVDARAATTAAEHGGFTPNVAPGATAPPNWVPSQQDDRPRH